MSVYRQKSNNYIVSRSEINMTERQTDGRTHLPRQRRKQRERVCVREMRQRSQRESERQTYIHTSLYFIVLKKDMHFTTHDHI